MLAIDEIKKKLNRALHLSSTFDLIYYFNRKVLH